MRGPMVGHSSHTRGRHENNGRTTTGDNALGPPPRPRSSAVKKVVGKAALWRPRGGAGALEAVDPAKKRAHTPRRAVRDLGSAARSHGRVLTTVNVGPSGCSRHTARRSRRHRSPDQHRADGSLSFRSLSLSHALISHSSRRRRTALLCASSTRETSLWDDRPRGHCAYHTAAPCAPDVAGALLGCDADGADDWPPWWPYAVWP
mmetsp:Transcript_45261/g.139625  ORF Transcript_45261/g.139625 Transcript_45261/m.139625 type:complete len:204 (+) Transcript_45261:423-1034(+)